MKNPDLGVRVATIDIGGWDAHTTCIGGKRTKFKYRDMMKNLATHIQQFDAEMGGKNYTMIIQSEFGRTNDVRTYRSYDEYATGGSDHGLATTMLLIGEKIKGKQLYGFEPTGANLRQYDLPVTTDYRTVIREVLGKGFAMNTGQLDNIFPGFSNTVELGLMNGRISKGTSSTLPNPIDCDSSGELFSDSFE